jgi:peptidyl-prolyl cis-trans isomerase A (cyclophilin A)
MTIRILALAALLALPAAGCKKNETKTDPSPTSPSSPTDDTASGPRSAGGGESPPTGQDGRGEGESMEVRAPTAADLATYTEGLEGDGPLTATFETSQGTIHCELLADGAPVTVANFVGLARGLHPFRHPETGKVERRPYYDGTVFHRVIPGFMVQGGDPTATGGGGPGYKFATEVSAELKHTPGTLSMANAGPNTNGAQFFITEKATGQLDGGYNVFGRCAELDVVKKLAGVEKTTQPGGREQSRPVNLDEVQLKSVTISRGKPGGN